MRDVLFLLVQLGMFSMRLAVLQAVVATAADQVVPSDFQERRNWWSLTPVENPPVPTVIDTKWSDHPVDQFVLAKLEEEGLLPAQLADPRTLVRRLSLTLTGLPPTPEEVDVFVRNAERDRVGAYEKLVERLLTSVHFGERWARHWMDVVRFAETYGFEWNFEIRDAWRYRDYLVRAFNANVPYDQLVREHLAGDLLVEPRINRQLGINESVIGTAFYRFSETGHDDCVMFPAIRFDALDSQIDTLSKAFQAATISCARCHDHKIDAISTADYYALVGILESSRPVVHTIDFVERFSEPMSKLRELKRAIRNELGLAWLADLASCKQQLLGVMAKIAAGKASTTEAEGSKEESALSPLYEQIIRKDLPRHNATFVLQQLATRSAADPGSVRSTWQRLEDEYRREQTAIEQFNSSNFELWVDFRESQESVWQAKGMGLVGNGPTRAGEFAVATEGDQVVSLVLPAGTYTHLDSDKLNGAIRSPFMPKQHKYVSLRFLAGGLSMVRAVIESCVLNEYSGGQPLYFAETTEQWNRFSTGQDATHRYFLELATKTDNPRWPERDGNEKSMDQVLRESPRSWFGVVRAVTHDCAESPKEELDHISRLLANAHPQALPDVAEAYISVLRDAVRAFSGQRATDEDVRWINWALDVEFLGNSAVEGTQLAQLVQAYRETEASISPPRVVVGMADHGAGTDFPVLLGGDPTAVGSPVPRGYLATLASDRQGFNTVGSGRLELAEAIASSDNPLTARVMVNRIWHHLFGTGLVETPDDFGHMGELPSHRMLLDYLANEFVEQGWSIKWLIRHIVTSQTFQQSNGADRKDSDRDIRNRLLHHFPVYRLDAEAIRDSLLTISGRLNRSQFGPSIQPYRTEEKLHRKLSSGPIDGNGRRSLYIKITRMEGAKFLELFDLPDPMTTRGRRDRTNVPAQALALLNDPFLIDQAQFWADRLIERGDSSSEKRIQWMYLKALGRPPNSLESTRFGAFVMQLAELHGVSENGMLDNRTIWKDACHVMFNTKELIYVR